MTARIAGLLAAPFALIAGGCSSDDVGPRPPLSLGTVDKTDPSAIASRGEASSPTPLPCSWDLGVAIAEVTLDGRGPYRFLLDTGAEYAVVSPRVAADAGMTRRTLADEGAWLRADDGSGGSRDVAQLVYAKELRVGEFTFRDVGALLLDLDGLERATGVRIDGALPGVAFRGGILTFDFARRSVTYAPGALDPSDADVLRLAARTDDRRPFVSLDVGGVTVPALLDSGHNGFLQVPGSLEPSLRFAAPPVEVGRTETVAGTSARRAGRIAGTVPIARSRVEDPVVELTGGTYPIVGTDLLREFQTAFDFENGLVRFARAAGASIRIPPVRGIGAGFLRDAGSWRVGYVLTGSPAERAGLAVGDRVESVESLPAAEVGYVAFRDLIDRSDAIRMRVAGPEGARDVSVEVATLVP